MFVADSRELISYLCVITSFDPQLQSGFYAFLKTHSVACLSSAKTAHARDVPTRAKVTHFLDFRVPSKVCCYCSKVNCKFIPLKN